MQTRLIDEPFFHIIQAAESFKTVIKSRDSVHVESETWDKLDKIATSIIPENMTAAELKVFNEVINS